MVRQSNRTENQTSNSQRRILLNSKARSFRAELRNLLFFNREPRGLRGFPLANFPRRPSLAKQKVATLSEAWRLVANLSRSQNGQLLGLGSSILRGARKWARPRAESLASASRRAGTHG